MTPQATAQAPAPMRDLSKINTIDFLLMSAGSALAAYSAGQSIRETGISMFFVGLIVLGTLFSFGMRKLLENSPFLKLDGWLYAGVLLFTIIQMEPLNESLPGEPFPRPLIAASYLSYMLALGSFVTWRDGTLLFQAVPAIALFGLVGCFDTFRNVTFAFFGFLLCLATLFARAHGRDMLRRASDSGFARRADVRSLRSGPAARDEVFYDSIRRGPWRWVAGPEWALASALAVVIISILGAPLLQFTVQAVAGPALVSMPRAVPTGPNPANVQLGDAQQLGRGPNTSLSDRPVFEANVSPDLGTRETLYFRTGIFDMYTGRGWTSGASISRVLPQLEIIRDSVPIRFEISKRTRVAEVPSLGQNIRWRGRTGAPSITEAGVYFTSDEGMAGPFFGNAEVRSPETTIGAATRLPEDRLWSVTDTYGIDEEVANFARAAIAGKTTDFERARALEAAIGQQVRYNIRARAVPQGVDPVRYFLFESREGYCDLFASAMVQLARSIGIPARYVQGFVPETTNRDANGNYVILERDYHAWAELLFDDVGWVVFDATTGAAEVEGGERRPANSTGPWYESTAAQVAGQVMAALAVVGLGFWAYRRQMSKLARIRPEEIAVQYGLFIRVLEKATGKRRPTGMTSNEYVEQAAERFPEARAEMEALNDRLVRANFAASTVEPGTLAALKTDIQAFRRRLSKMKARPAP